MCVQVQVIRRGALPRTKEIAVANSANDLKTSQSVTGRVYQNVDTLDARVCHSTEKKIVQGANFREKIDLEEQKAQTEDRFLEAHMI